LFLLRRRYRKYWAKYYIEFTKWSQQRFLTTSSRMYCHCSKLCCKSLIDCRLMIWCLLLCTALKCIGHRLLAFWFLRSAVQILKRDKLLSLTLGELWWDGFNYLNESTQVLRETNTFDLYQVLFSCGQILSQMNQAESV